MFRRLRAGAWQTPGTPKPSRSGMRSDKARIYLRDRRGQSRSQAATRPKNRVKIAIPNANVAKAMDFLITRVRRRDSVDSGNPSRSRGNASAEDRHILRTKQMAVRRIPNSSILFNNNGLQRNGFASICKRPGRDRATCKTGSGNLHDAPRTRSRGCTRQFRVCRRQHFVERFATDGPSPDVRNRPLRGDGSVPWTWERPVRPSRSRGQSSAQQFKGHASRRSGFPKTGACRADCRKERSVST